MSNHPSQKTDEAQFDINESSYKTSHAAVRKARRFTLQGLYEWLMTDHRFEQTGQTQFKANAPHDIAARTRASNAMHTVHLGYYHEMMREIPEHIEALEALIQPHLDRDINQLDLVEHSILLIGAYELQNSMHIPYKVVIDEAMKLNTHFGATDGHKLINAVMDKLATELRGIEVSADTGRKSKKQSLDNLNSDSEITESAMDTQADVKSDTTNGDSINDTNGKSDSESAEPMKPRIGRKSTTPQSK